MIKSPGNGGNADAGFRTGSANVVPNRISAIARNRAGVANCFVAVPRFMDIGKEEYLLVIR